MSETIHKKKPANTLAVILYVFSGLAAALGILLLIAMISGAAGVVPSFEMFFVMAGLGQIAGLILNPLRSALINLGILLFVLMAAIAALLFTAGKLLTRQATLAERVARLEEKVGM